MTDGDMGQTLADRLMDGAAARRADEADQPEGGDETDPAKLASRIPRSGVAPVRFCEPAPRLEAVDDDERDPAKLAAAIPRSGYQIKPDADADSIRRR